MVEVGVSGSRIAKELKQEMEDGGGRGRRKRKEVEERGGWKEG